ncbi:MAG: hypothetical protein J6V50_03435, partial [Clostridia bacterium]|nr:hypothetical protein [Clostridia bacterium]
MREIHKNEFCRDIAIWYVEYLVPGEDFNATIKEELGKSKLFALLVTPSVIEPKNYIISHEYPLANELSRQKGLPILPIETVKTNKSELSRLFEDIPPVADGNNAELLSDALRDSLKNVALMKNSDDPLHNFLIGIAYLIGIDVETDYDRGISLITSAAELPEAKKKLSEIYKKGIGRAIDYKTALLWEERLITQYKELFKNDKSYGIKIAEESVCKYDILCAMGEGTKGEDTLLDAIAYSEYYPMPKRVKMLIDLYMALSSVQEKKKAAEYSFEAQFSHYAEIRAAGLNAYLKAEEIAMENAENTDLAPQISFLLVGIFERYLGSGEVEKAKEYREKNIEFCEKHYPEGLEEFENYCRLAELKMKINWETLEGATDYYEAYLETIDEQNLAKTSPRGLIPSVSDLCDIISYLSRTKSEEELLIFEKIIQRFVAIYESIPTEEAENDILSLLSRLYSVVSDFETAKGNAEASLIFGLRGLDATKTMLERSDSDLYRSVYFNLALSLADSAFALSKYDLGAGITSKANEELQKVASKNTNDETLTVLARVCLNFAKFHAHNDKINLAADCFEKAKDTVDFLCSHSVNIKNILLFLSVYSHYTEYLLKFDCIDVAADFCDKSTLNIVSFLKYVARQESVNIPSSEMDKLASYYQQFLRFSVKASERGKNYKKEEETLRILLETNKHIGGKDWINDHYNLATSILLQNRPEDAAKFFEMFISLTTDITAENRYQYALSLMCAAPYNEQKREEYYNLAVENFLILYEENPNDTAVIKRLKELLGENFKG